MALYIAFALLFCAISSIVFHPELGLVYLLFVVIIKTLLKELHPIFEVLDYTLVILFVTFFSSVFKYSKVFKRAYFPVLYVVIFLLFVGLLSLSALYTSQVVYGILKLARFVVIVGVLFFLSMFLFQFEGVSRRFLNLALYLILLLSVVHIVIMISFINTLTMDNPILIRFGIAGNPIGSGRIFGLGIILAASRFFMKKGIRNHLLTIAFVSILLVALFSTNSRGPILMLVVTLVGYLIFLDKKHIVTIMGILLVFFILSGVVISLLPKFFTSRVIAGLYGANIGGNFLNLTTSNGQRVWLIGTCLEKISEFNLIQIFLGKGLGSFAEIWRTPDFIRGYPHNIFLELLFESGVVTVLVFIMSIVLIIRDVIRYYIKRRQHDYILFSYFLSLIYFFLNSMVSGDINDNRFIWMFMGASIGYLVYHNDVGNREYFPLDSCGN